VAGKKGLMGCSYPLAIVIILVVLFLIVIGIAAGPLGQSLFKGLNLPDWLSVPKPEPELPAETIFHISGFSVTNTMLATWITVAFLIVCSFLITRRMKLIPGRAQAAFEFVLGWLYDFCTSAAGEKNGRRFFPLVATIFLFVGFNAWLGLLPGYGVPVPIGDHGAVHLIRPANTDFNTPLAVACIAVIAVQYYGLKTAGARYLAKFVNVGGFARIFRGFKDIFKGKVIDGITSVFTGIVEIALGMLEFLSEFVIRIISFTFRLFGNMTAGEVLIMVALFLIPFLFALPFYVLELLVGFLQAIIFAGLTLIFLTMAVSPHEGDEHT
jgi:F-type H+-transporting ATPase subunit a